MEILVVADIEETSLWGSWSEDMKERLKEVDLIVSAGDLSAAYLEFLVTMLNVPLLYVRGNHDESYHTDPPEGCVDIDGKCVDVQGLRIAGLGGSMRYRNGTDMYTEEEMEARVRRLKKDMRRQRRRDWLRGAAENAGRTPDILVTHAPCLGYGDIEDLPHRGFACFNDLLDEWKPSYHFYGHVHKSYGYGNYVREMEHPSGTRLINCFGMYFLELD